MGRKAPPPYHHNDEWRHRIERVVQRDDPPRWRRAEMRSNYEEQQDSTDSEHAPEAKDEEAQQDELGFPAVGSLAEEETGASRILPDGLVVSDAGVVRGLNSVDVTEVFLRPELPSRPKSSG